MSKLFAAFRRFVHRPDYDLAAAIREHRLECERELDELEAVR